MFAEAETAVEFEPEHFREMAGLTLYYNTRDYVYLWISRGEKLGKYLGLVRSVNGKWEKFSEAEVTIEKHDVLS